MNLEKGRVRRLALVLISVFSTIIAIGCGSGVYSRITPTQNPLVAQYEILASGVTPQAWVEFGPTVSYGRQTSWVSAVGKTGTALQILVAGMKPSTTYHMRAHVAWPDGSTWVDQDHTFTTGALPSGLTPPSLSVAEPTPGLSPAPGVELLCLSPPNSKMLASVVADTQGNIIWYYPAIAQPIKPLPNGHFIVNTAADLLEIDLAGNVIRDISMAQVNQSLQAIGRALTIVNLSHDVLVSPNGHWITIGQVAQDYTDLPGYPGTISVLGDVVVDIDPSGNVAWAWSAFDYLDINRHPEGLPDWTHSNALVYTDDGNLLLSMRNQSWVLKLDYANGTGAGDILWKLGEDGDFTLTGGDPSEWFYGQHYPNILSVDGSQSTMAVYDDGNLRLDVDGVACGTSSSAPACYSRGTIFQIDESTNLATLLWQDLPGFFSFWGGSIGQLSNGDVEFDSSDPANAASAVIMEVTPTQNPQIVWQMNINNENAYRGYRIPSLYPGITWKH